MATAKSTLKIKVINRNLVIAGEATVQGVLDTLKEARTDAQATAMEALTNNDRKGVLQTMRIDGTYQRAILSLERAILRAQRVRLTKEEKAKFELDGTLPAGYEQVNIADDDDDDDDGE